MKKFTFSIGLRYLFAKKQGFLSLISFISIFGVALGVATLIIVISVMNGFHDELKRRIIGTNAHVIVAPYFIKGGIPDYNEKVKKIEKINHVKAAVPYFMSQVMLKYKNKVEGIVLWGIIPDKIEKVNNLKQNIIKGDLQFISKNLPDNKKGIIIGKELADILNADLGDDIILISPVFHQTPAGPMPKITKLKIVGIFSSGMYDYDLSYAYVDIKTAQSLLEKGDVATGIAVKVDKLENASLVATEIHRQFKHLWARDWMSMNENLFTAIKIEKITMFIILTLIVLVAAFNIASTLIMLVMRKTKDIGILKSIGASNKDIMNIFIVLGVATGIIGTILGFFTGTGVCILLQKYPIAMPGGGSVYFIDKLAVAMKMRDLIIIPISAILISFLAAIYPSYQAAKLDPVEAIRYE